MSKAHLFVFVLGLVMDELICLNLRPRTCNIPAFAADSQKGDGGGVRLCHPAPVQLHYLAAGTQTGGSHSLGLFISETLSFWGPEASASTSVKVEGAGLWGCGEEGRGTETR